MSVDITAHIGVGWVIPQEKYEQMMEAAGDNRTEVEDYFRYINNYSAVGDVFLGEFLVAADPGRYTDLANLSNYIDIDTFVERMADILELCGEKVGPGTEWFDVRTYLINRVW